MPHIFALVQSGVVVNTVLASPTDYQYPPYAWVDINNYQISFGYMPGIGWTTSDNVNFTQPS